MRPYDTLFNWPNILTIVRILVIPLLIIVFYLPFSWGHLVASLLFACASVTDWLDGYLARYLKQSTKLGAFLDPVADKLMVSTALVLIVAEPVFNIQTAALTIPAAIIIAREIIVSALREWMAEIGKHASVAVSHLGKLKTAVQMVALVILLYCNQSTPIWLVLIGYLMLYIAVILTIWSMMIYLRAAWKEMIALS